MAQPVMSSGNVRPARALVVGASGQVGGALMEALRARGHEATGTYAAHPAEGAWPLDLTHGEAVEHAVMFVKPDWIFCPAGLSHVDYCEAHPDEAMRLNRDAPLHLARMGQRLGARFVYYSTDYVFDGVGGPFKEEDAARPLNAYGRSKLEGERALLDAIPRALVLRTSVVYGPEAQEKNFVYQLIRACREGRPFRPASDQRASSTYNPDLAAASVELCEQGAEGLFHVAGSETLDRWAFARLIVTTFALDGSQLTPVKTAELGQPAARPLDGGLNVAKAQARVRTRLRGVTEGLRAMRDALAARGR
jgi:dTDP-4-dehydrorhamnose reductase